MTEQEWLTCSDPYEMTNFLRPKRSDRKFRLFGCACVRGVWQHLPENALRQATETCERFADGLATAGELRAARESAHATYQGIGDIIADHSAIAVEGLCEVKPWIPMGEGSSGGIAAVAAEAWSTQDIPFHVAWEMAKQAHCNLLRCIFGPLPFRPVTLHPSWLTPNILTLAQAIYDDRAFDRLHSLADALEEAGCKNEDILSHCRSPGPHVRGCWVVDLVLGRA